MMRASARSLFALAALVLYLLPSGLGTVARMAHDAEHALESQLGADRPDARGALVHTHGGSTHAHGPGVEALARAAAGLESTPEDDEELELPPVVLYALLSPSGPGVSPPDALRTSPFVDATAPWAGPSPAPPVPPPDA